MKSQAHNMFHLDSLGYENGAIFYMYKVLQHIAHAICNKFGKISQININVFIY